MKKLKICIWACLMLSAAFMFDDSLAVAIYLFAALCHEAGHILAAKIMKIGIGEINIDLSGAHICTTDSISYKSELFLAAAGPMANFLAVSIAIAIAKVQKIPAKMLFDSAEMIFLGEGTTFSGILGFFVISSLMQASSNLLPIKGFDGGRVVYCLLAMAFGERAAEVTLDITSALVAFILWTVALYLMLKISAGLGVYVFALGIFASNVMKTQRAPTKLIS